MRLLKGISLCGNPERQRLHCVDLPTLNYLPRRAQCILSTGSYGHFCCLPSEYEAHKLLVVHFPHWSKTKKYVSSIDLTEGNRLSRQPLPQRIIQHTVWPERAQTMNWAWRITDGSVAARIIPMVAFKVRYMDHDHSNETPSWALQSPVVYEPWRRHQRSH